MRPHSLAVELAGPGTVRFVRDGVPLAGLTPVDVLSQLTHRVFGPLHADRIRIVLDYHGADGHTAGTLTEVAARHGVSTRTVSNHVRAVRSAGETLPLQAELAAAVIRSSRAGEDHLARVRVARTLGLPEPRPAEKPAVSARDGVSSNVAAAARSATRLLAAVGPLPLDVVHGAVTRGRRFRRRTPFTAGELEAALNAAGGVAGSDGRWHAPTNVPVTDRYRVIVEQAAGQESLTRAGMIEILSGAGYTRSSASGRMSSSHPLFERAGPDRYRLIGTPAAPDGTGVTK